MQFEIGNRVIIKNRKAHEMAIVLSHFRRKGVNYYDIKTEKGSIIQEVPDDGFSPVHVQISLSTKLNTLQHEQEG